MHESHRAALRAMPTPSSVSHAACAFFVTSSVAAAAAETEADAGGFTYAPEHKASAIKFQDVSRGQATNDHPTSLSARF